MYETREPPGRALRLRLRHRVDVAAHGAQVLERTLRALRAEEQLATSRCDQAERRWRDAVVQAEAWLRRAAVFGGQRGIGAAARDGVAEVEFGWTTTMGMRHRIGATCEPARRTPDDPPAAGTALLRAEDAYRAVLVAAADLAAAQTSVRALRGAVAVTRRRARVLRRHWIPTLSDALAACELVLQEREHEEWVRRRWIAQRRAAAP